MKGVYSVLIFILLILSIFSISVHFVSPSDPTNYLSLGGSYILAVMIIVSRYKQTLLGISASELLIGALLLFAIIYGVFNKNISFEWTITCFSLLFFYALTKRFPLNFDWLFTGIVGIGIVQSIYGIGQYLYWLGNIAAPGFRISGSFDNPAGFAAALSVCFPFTLFLLHKKKLYWKITGIFASLLFIVAIVLSESRTGIVTVTIISGIWDVKTSNPECLKSLGNKTKIVGSATLVITILVGLYFLKKDSADGRLLIWQCSGQMMADKPLFGHGTGGFQKEYMLYQADYFRNHPESGYIMRADIVKHPFNEFILLFAEYGLVGGILFVFVAYLLIREYKKNKNNETFYPMLTLLAIAVFACFSYPLKYPFVRLILVFSAAIIMRNEPKCVCVSASVVRLLKPLVLIALTGMIVLTGQLFYNEYYWNKIARRSLAGETKEVLPEYARLYPWMRGNGLFLYNYAAELNYIGDWKKSNELMTECSKLYNDNDVQLILADNYQQLKQYEQAEQHLKLAYEMIPNRFIPLYRLVQLYKLQKREDDAQNLAKLIIRKPIKIPSYEIDAIKTEMKKIISSKID